MGVFESEDDDILGPGGPDDLKIGLKMIEDVEKYLKDVKQCITDPHYKNCKSLGSYMLEKEIPDLLKRSVEYIGHSDTYKRDHNIDENDKSVNDAIDKTDTNKIKTSNVLLYILKYLAYNDKQSLNILKQYSKKDLLSSIKNEGCYNWVRVRIKERQNKLLDLVNDAELAKTGIDWIKNNFDKDIIGWFEEISTAGRLLTFDTYDYNTSRAILAYNYYRTHPNIEDIFISKKAIRHWIRMVLEDRDGYLEYFDLEKYRDELVEEYWKTHENYTNFGNWGSSEGQRLYYSSHWDAYFPD